MYAAARSSLSLRCHVMARCCSGGSWKEMGGPIRLALLGGGSGLEMVPAEAAQPKQIDFTLFYTWKTHSQ